MAGSTKVARTGLNIKFCNICNKILRLMLHNPRNAFKHCTFPKPVAKVGGSPSKPLQHSIRDHWWWPLATHYSPPPPPSSLDFLEPPLEDNLDIYF